MRKVGTNHSGYANERNISGLPLSRYEVVRARNLLRLPNYLHFRLRGKMQRHLGNLHWDAGLPNCDLHHFFNGISLGKTPWISTFETFLPRWLAYGPGDKTWALKKLASPACKQLIALSECSRQIQLDFMKDHADLAAQVAGKICVLHPSQTPLISGLEEKEYENGPLKLMFVGADFFRKGGLETLQAVDALVRQGAELHLTIVSSLNIGDYASRAGQQELALAKQLIAAHPRHIQHHLQLPNADVLEGFRAAHIGLLPTWADTYGYAALESMAAGCPVIATNVRALPEIVDAEKGWLISLEKDSWGNALLDTAEQRKNASEQIRNGIQQALEEALKNRAMIAEKARLSFAHILQHHDPRQAAAQTENLYDKALGV